MKNPIRSTILYALGSGVVAFLTTPLAGVYGYRSPVAGLLAWGLFAVYGVLLARWSGTRLLSVLFPAALLLGAAVWTGGHTGFFLLALGVFSWVRSGICFTETPLRSLMAELLTVAGGVALLNLLLSPSAWAWPLGICLFILVQALYFYIVPWKRSAGTQGGEADPFVRASQEAERVLDGLS